MCYSPQSGSGTVAGLPFAGQMTCHPHFVSFAQNLIPVSRHRGYLPQPLSGSTRPAIANPAANAVTGRSLAARTELGAQLRAGGRRRAEDIMMTERRTLLARSMHEESTSLQR